MSIKQSKEQSRGDNFTDKIQTSICNEEASDDSPWLAKSVHWQGYSQESLLDSKSYTEVVWLLLRGDLPNDDQGINVTELYRFSVNRVAAGVQACYTEAADNPAGSFLPLRCADIEYTGKSPRELP